MTEISSRALRTFYDETFDRGVSPAAYRDARDVAEYLSLARLAHPLLTTEGARSTAPAHLRDLIPDLGAPPGVVTPGRLQVIAGESIDLASATCDAAATALSLRGAESIEHWDRLDRWPNLRHLSLDQCRLDAAIVEAPRRAVGSLSAYEVNATAARCVLGLVDAARIEIVVPGATLDLRWIVDPQRVTDLTASADRIVRVEALDSAPLSTLSLSSTRLPSRARSLVSRASATLTRLHVSCVMPFDPTDLFDVHEMPRLRTLAMPAFPERRAAWIDYAVAHPTVGFSFASPRTLEAAPMPAGIHDGLPIMKVKVGRRTRYEVAVDLATASGYPGNNGDVETALRGALSLEDGEISSESDELVYRGPTKKSVVSFLNEATRVLSSRSPARPG